MANVYIASLYSTIEQMREVAKRLTEAGHSVTSRWLDGSEEHMTREAAALMDVADVDFADVVLSFTLPRKTMHNGGGRHWEFGYAYGTGKRNIIVGPKGEHVFHYLPSVEHFETLEEAIGAL